MKTTIDLANRWEFNPRDGLRGILVHGLDEDGGSRVGISFSDAREVLAGGICTEWRDSETQDLKFDAKKWVEEGGAVVVGELTVPVIEGSTSQYIVNGNPLGYFYLLVTEESHSEMVDYFKGRAFQE